MKRLGTCEGPCGQHDIQIVARGLCQKCINRAYYLQRRDGVQLPGAPVNGKGKPKAKAKPRPPLPSKPAAVDGPSATFIGTAHQPKAF